MANSKLKSIRTEKDHEAALARIDALMDAEPGSAEFEELDVLADFVERYEGIHEPMGYPGLVAAIEFRMEQGNLSPRDLTLCIGSSAKVSEVFSGKRAITMPMARALHKHLGIPADVLRREPGIALDDLLVDKAIVKVTYQADSGWPSQIEKKLRKRISALVRQSESFKIGITNWPEQRAHQHERDYGSEFSEMIVLYKTRTRDNAAKLEANLIGYYRDRYELRNERGGGGGRYGEGWYFLYLIR